MRRLLGFLTLSALLISAPAVANELDDLIAGGTANDGVQVTLTGELVGDFSPRSEGIWVQLNVDPYVDAPLLETGKLAGTNNGIGAFLPSDLFDEGWGEPGGYRNRGPVVTLTAIFRYHDPRFQGETYLDVSAVTLVTPSVPLEQAPSSTMLVLGLAAIAAAGLIHFGTGGFKRLVRRFS